MDVTLYVEAAADVLVIIVVDVATVFSVGVVGGGSIVDIVVGDIVSDA